MFKEETLGERHGLHTFASACFGPTKKATFSVVLLKGKERGEAAVWFSKFGVLL